ncbi:MAG: His/Gly/Thr/Pro-type tRNA ligase C-terminal domain-containing protein, partial [Bacilli bacterium]|nr:His/Gly/Thr/Pro-type tRNA ligase C-terminal domain-containing protein [Bacilli bacterium]
YWKDYCLEFLNYLGLSKDNIRYRDHSDKELSFYSKATTDIEYLYPFGWGELWGIADRTDYDLKVHQEHSGENLEYFDPLDNSKYLPFVVEPSVGVERLFLAVLSDCFEKELLADGETRDILHLKPYLAPIKVAVLPLVNKLTTQAEEVYQNLQKYFNCDFDTSGKIGKRYRRQDAIGTPYCVTIDYDSLEDNCVTIRERDTMEQERLPFSDIVNYVKQRIEG